jgi:hypothetical protein
MRQNANGKPKRTSRGAPPKGTSLDQIFLIQATQGGHSVQVHLHYDKAIWSGLSWGVGEIRHEEFDSSSPLVIRCASLESQPVDLKVELYAVTY